MVLRTLLVPTCLLALSALANDAEARPALATYESVDSYSVTYKTMSITGVIQGASAPSTTQYPVASGTDFSDAAACREMLLTMMNRPGRFLLVIEDSDPN